MMNTLESMSSDTTSIFLDTSAFLVFMDAEHAYHLKAASLFYDFDDLNRPLVTLNLIVYQVHDWLKDKSGFADAQFFLQAVRKAEQNQLLTIIPVEEGIERSALRLMDENPEQELTFLTACSLTAMNQFGMRRIFSFDRQLEWISHLFPRIQVVPSQIYY